MRIAAVRAIPVDIPYHKPFVIAGGPSTVATHVIVKITSDDGTVGIGEAAPMTSYSEETQADIIHAVERFLGPAVVGRDPLDLELIHELMERHLPGHHFAKAAVDLACYDLAGKTLGVPVYKLLGGLYRTKIPLAWAVGMDGIDAMVAEAVEFAGRGFETIKVKIGNDPRKDLEVVAAIRDAIGPKVGLRVDANQGYTPTVAIQVLRRMEKYDLQLIEQPVPRWDLDGMARVAAALDTPIMADESMFGPNDAINLIRFHACDIINIKIMKPGGLYNSKKVAAIAEAADIPCLVGSMIETGVGTAAGVHFAASTRNIAYPCELIGPMMLKDDVIKEDIYSANYVRGYLEAPGGPGLGVRLVENLEGMAAHV
ncbi:MAG: enolase C-terminal domain-like protein [Bacillota bacterium]